MGRTSRQVVLIVAAFTTIGCDRVTKYTATTMLAGEPARSYWADTLRLGYAENPGGFLSVGANLPPVARTAFFTVATGLMLVMMAVYAIRRRGDRWSTLGLTLFVAGGASNWLDRIARGSVVDFLNVGIGPVRTGVFNVADLAIMLGAATFIVSEIRKSGSMRPAPQTDRLKY